jgi:hypothetical protein
MGTKTESCKHLENQTVAWEVTYGFRDNAFVKNSNGILGGGDLYSGRVEVIKWSSFVNSNQSIDSFIREFRRQFNS